MRRMVLLLFAAALVIGLCACRQSTGSEQPSTENTTVPTTQPTTVPITEPATNPTTQPVVTEPDPPAPPAEPDHTELFLPEVSGEDMIRYFNEVVLDTEYAEGDGDATLVQKWLSPLYCHITGTPTDEDLRVLEGLFAQLNQIPGFPGIYTTEDAWSANVTVSFLNEGDFMLAFSDFIQGETADGAVQFWYYTASNEIHTGRIGYRTDVSQEIRNSVLLEEIINLLGFSDTVLRSDSIVYQYSSDATELSDVDWVLLKLLYDPAIECGMNAEDCRQVLEQLYY